MKRRIGNGCSRDDEAKRRVTVTDLAAACGVGRDAAGASSRHVADGGLNHTRRIGEQVGVSRRVFPRYIRVDSRLTLLPFIRSCGSILHSDP